ncbi:hypothetical protein PSQ90_02405 [Devosia rhodophyticola]|uniref:Bacterial Ig domain-containing protein n=1 Tax=Devosia rhodophyticola TaxID=3026423 RepID=A0ABY7YY68_9HYPH|nr:hypothetical protein [Devosia rhodophyticola]WDR06338.1 hypothetical protein PSQ90_02405 [Devosia rhodophyticola]
MLIVIGVLTGPTVVNCFNSPEGMGLCLRGHMPGVPATTTETAALPEQAAAADGAQAAVGETEVSVTPPNGATDAPVESAPEGLTVPDDLVAATFGLLRAEPDGSVVIAGSGTPTSEIEVFANGDLLGKTTVESSGDWVLVPDAPLPPGGVEITLGETGKTAVADKSFVVVIDPDRQTEPLVVTSEPGQASDILQGLSRPAPVQTATAEPTAPQTPAVDLDCSCRESARCSDYSVRHAARSRDSA